MSVLQDTRIALRLLARAPATTAIALISIAVSTGAAGVVFAAIKSVLLSPLPYARAEELVQLRSEYPRMQQQSTGDWVFWDDAQEVIRRTRTLESVGVYGNALYDLGGDASTPPEALYGLRITANLFATLGAAPMLGRNILPDEAVAGHAEVMILSYGLWVRRFHADRRIVGRTVTVNGHECLVIGVMPPEFNFPMRRSAAHTPSPYVEFWAPLVVRPGAKRGGLGAVGRLRAGVSAAEARADIAEIGDALAREFPATNRDRTLTLSLLRDRTVGSARGALWLLMGATLLFVLIGCSNVANLLLARATSRRNEFAVRVAVGAGRGRIVRQLLTESCVLALLGGAGGFALAAMAWKVLPAVAPVSIPRLAAARADSTVFFFSLTMGMVSGILFGMAPALGMARVTLGVRGAAGIRDRVRPVLVMMEVALSVVLVVIGGQLLGNFRRLVAADPGFEADHILASVVLPSPERYPDAERRGLFYRRILDSVRALPGVDGAGTVDALPFSGENHGGFVVGGRSTQGPLQGGIAPPAQRPARINREVRSSDFQERLTAEIDVAGGEYLQTMGIHLVEGRWFREEEMSASNDAAIVNTFVARRLWPGERAIGQRICLYCTPENPNNWKRVIGVVASASHAALNEPESGNVYVAAGAMQTAQFLVVRTARPAGEMGTAIRRAIAGLDANQTVFLTASMRELIGDSVADRRFITLLLTATGCLALLLSAAGVYGVIAYTTSRRTQEIGIRMAVGATPGNVLALIFRQGFAAVAMGLGLGLGAAMAALGLLRTVLPGLEGGQNGYVWAAVSLVMVMAAMACWVPAHRATRTDPLEALRQV